MLFASVLEIFIGVAAVVKKGLNINRKSVEERREMETLQTQNRNPNPNTNTREGNGKKREGQEMKVKVKSSSQEKKVGDNGPETNNKWMGLLAARDKSGESPIA